MVVKRSWNTSYRALILLSEESRILTHSTHSYFGLSASRDWQHYLINFKKCAFTFVPFNSLPDSIVERKFCFNLLNAQEV